ncbi:hypothetical protein LEP1GSC109_1969 [Leptospira interrogans str. UI 13372]|nr:hypothetical protein [Leptospira interrogans]EMO96260.1 hypothetical protein LEP1GSC109_1969 [Leptospira interrogans str. UI 13372]
MKSEKETRKDIIDQRLQKAGWNLQDRTQVIEEFDIEVKNFNGLLKARSSTAQHQFSDYVLIGKNGKPIAVVEAKKLLKIPRSEESRPSNIVIAYKKNTEVRYHFVFIRMDMIYTFGIWEITHLRKYMVSRLVTIWNDTLI